MTALDEGTPRVRLRHAAETAPGRRVMISVADLLAVLDEQLLPRPIDLDGPASEAHAPEPAAPVRAPRAVQPPRGSGIVVLAATNVDAGRLARAAWDTDPERVAQHGPYDDADPRLTWHTVTAARRALDQLAGETR